MSDNLFKVSQSKVKTWRRCHRAYWNKYVEKLRRRKVARPLMFGRMVHDMIDAYANGDDPFEVLAAINLQDMKLFASEKEEYGEIVRDVGHIMEDYFEFWDERALRYLRKNGKAAEHEFEIELFPDVLWNGKIDALGRTPNRLTWLVEHKTFTKMPGEDERWRNLQSATYFKAVEILGWEMPDGMAWDYIRSKSPAVPGLLKNGKPSSRKVDSLPSALRAWMKENGKNAKDYQKLMTNANDNRDDWFKRIFTPVSAEVVDRVFADFKATVREMTDNHGRVKDMNIERHCSWCEYEPLCRAELLGGDVDYIKQKEYENGSKNRPQAGTTGGRQSSRQNTRRFK